MSFTDEEILSQLEKTADGEYITPQTDLWQIDPQGMIEDGNAWRVDNVYSYQRLVDYPVFSSEAAAKRSIRSAEQMAADRITDLESHIVGMQVKAESDQKLIKQQVAQIKSLKDTVHEQRAADKQTYSLACWAAKHEVSLKFSRRYEHIPYEQDSSREMVMELQTPATSSTQLISRGDNVPSIGTLFQDALLKLRDVQEALKG